MPDLPSPVRVGHGYDLHRLEPRPPRGQGRTLVIAGVRFEEHHSGPISHSDGDVVYHAVTDAILGGLGEPDIGQLFPDNDPRNRGADSANFLREAFNRMTSRGFTVGNVDVTVICQSPKLTPHKQAMTENIASVLGCPRDRINLKGKTHEQVDAVGEGRAIECHAVVLLTGAGTR